MQAPPGPPVSLEKELEGLHARSFGWALACCGRDAERAHEVLQDAYFKVLDGRARFDHRSAMKTWFFGVIRMTALEHRRWTALRFLRRRDDVDVNDAVSVERQPDSAADASARARAVSAALARLPARQREVLHLVFYEEITIREAAEVMGVALGTARLHYERGKQSLAAILQKEGPVIR